MRIQREEISEREVPAELKELCVICVRNTTLSICARHVPAEHKAANASRTCRYFVITLPKGLDRLLDGHVSFSGCFSKCSSSDVRRVSHSLMRSQLQGVNAEPRPCDPTLMLERLSGLANDIHPSLHPSIIHRSSIIPRSEGCWGQSQLAQCQWVGLHPGQAASSSPERQSRGEAASSEAGVAVWTVAPGLLTALKDSFVKNIR